MGPAKMVTCFGAEMKIVKPSVGSEEVGLKMGSEMSKQPTSKDDQILKWQLNVLTHTHTRPLPVEIQLKYVDIDKSVEAYSVAAR